DGIRDKLVTGVQTCAFRSEEHLRQRKRIRPRTVAGHQQPAGAALAECVQAVACQPLRKLNDQSLRVAMHQRADRGTGVHLAPERSEEHTSELQSLAYLVCR